MTGFSPLDDLPVSTNPASPDVWGARLNGHLLEIEQRIAAVETGGSGWRVASASDEVVVFSDGDTNTVTFPNPGAQTGVTGVFVAVPLSATSSGGEGITYASDSLPPGLQLLSKYDMIAGIPTTAGSYDVVVTATDDTGASASVEFAWGLTNDIEATAPAAQTATVGTALSLTIPFTDSSATATASVSATGLPAGVSATLGSDGRSVAVSGAPSAPQASTNCTVTISDNSGASKALTFAWTVTGATTNVVTLDAIPNQTNSQGAVVSLPITAHTTGGSASIVSIAASGRPTGTLISQGTTPGTATIKGPLNKAGTFTVTITATDSTGAVGTETFTWTVTAQTGGGTTVTSPTLVTPGAAPVGSSLYPVPTANAIYLDTANGNDANAGTVATAPVKTLAKAISLATAISGTVVCRGGTTEATAGIAHESVQTSSTASPVTIQNYPGEFFYLEGASVVTGWTASGGAWTHSGIPLKLNRAGLNGGWSTPSSTTPANFPAGTVAADFTTDANGDKADQVFLVASNGAITALKQIADGATPAAGQFSVNYTANTITIGSDPTGQTVKVSDLRYALIANSVVNVKGIGVRMHCPDYGTSALNAPLIFGGNSSGSIVENVQISYSSMSAVSVRVAGIGLDLLTCRHIAFTCIAADRCDGVNPRDSLFDQWNEGLFKATPQTAAIKITRSINPVIWNCVSTNGNGGNGFWCDMNGATPVYAHCKTDATHNKGFHMEESDGGNLNGTQTYGIIVGCRDEGSKYGLAIFAAGHIKVYNSEFVNAQTQFIDLEMDNGRTSRDSYLTATQCPWVLQSIDVANCIIGPGTPVETIRAVWSSTDQTPPKSADAMGIRFLTNYFAWTTGAAIQWGDGTAAGHYTDYEIASYGSLQAAINAAQSAHPSNLIGNSATAIADANATPLPADVAAAAGVSAGITHMGRWATT